MMNNAVTAPALSSTWTCAPIELDRARVGVRASRFAAHHGAQHVSRCIMTPDICPSTASVQPSTLDSGEASIYVHSVAIALRPSSAQARSTSARLRDDHVRQSREWARRAREIFTPLASDALVGKRVKKLLEELAALDA